MAERDDEDAWFEAGRALHRKEAELRVVENECYVLDRLLMRAGVQRDALSKEVATLKERKNALFAELPPRRG